jgi:urease beta subunit
MADVKALVRPSGQVRDSLDADKLLIGGIDYGIAGGTLTLGTVNATALSIGSPGVVATVLGDLSVNGIFTIVDGGSMIGDGDITLGGGDGDTITLGGSWVTADDIVNIGTVNGIHNTTVNLRCNMGVLQDKRINFDRTADSEGALLLPDTKDAPVGLAMGMVRVNGAGFLQYYNGAAWVTVVSTAYTLDDAYDAGGAGVGRSITADSGAVDISVPVAVNGTALALHQLMPAATANVMTIENLGAGGASLELLGTRRLIQTTAADMTVGLTSNDANPYTLHITAANAGAGTAGIGILAKNTLGIESSAGKTVIHGYNDAGTAIEIDSTLNAGGILIGCNATTSQIGLGTNGARSIYVGSTVASSLQLVSLQTMLQVTANDALARTLTISSTNVGAGTAILNIDADDAITMDSAVAGISLDAVTASNFTVSAGVLTLAGVYGIELLTDANDALARAMTIRATNVGVGTSIINIDAKNTITIDAGDGISIDAGGASNFSTSAGALTLEGVGVDVNSTGAVTIDSTAGTIGIGTGADNFAVNIGTAGDRTVKLGSGTGVSATTIYSGTGAQTFTAGGAWDVNATGAVTLDSTGGTIGLGTGADNFAVNIGTAGDRTVKLGSGTGVSATTIYSGTGAMTFTAGGIWDVNATGAATISGDTIAITGTGLSGNMQIQMTANVAALRDLQIDVENTNALGARITFSDSWQKDSAGAGGYSVAMPYATTAVEWTSFKTNFGDGTSLIAATNACSPTSIGLAGLTPGRVVIVGAGPVLADDADLTFNGTDLNVNGKLTLNSTTVAWYPSALVTGTLIYGNGAAGIAVGGDTNTIVGIEAGNSLTTAQDNTFVGYRAGFTMATGTNRHVVAVGSYAGYTTTGLGDCCIGYGAGQRHNGSYGTFLGYLAGYGAAGYNAGNVVVVGYRAGYSLGAGASYNVYIGSDCGYNATTGVSNLFAGQEAGKGAGAYTGADYNVCLGYRAGYVLGDDADSNVMLGPLAGSKHTTGDNQLYIANSANTSLIYGDFSGNKLGLCWDTSAAAPTLPTYDLSLWGSAARELGVMRHATADTAGNSLTLRGGGATVGATNKAGGNLNHYPGVSTGSGTSDTVFYAYPGIAAAAVDNAPVEGARVTYQGVTVPEGLYYRYGAGILAYAQTALHNYYFGSAGNLTTTGEKNTVGGDSAGIALAALAHGNTMWGASAGYNSSTGTYNVFVGMEAGYGSGGVYDGSNYNVAVGYRAGYDIGAAALNNTLIGAHSGQNLTTGDLNVFVGSSSGTAATTLSYTTAVGASALFSTTGVSNTALGYLAGYYNQTGVCNVFLGYQAGYGSAGVVYDGSSYNTFVGYRAGYDIGAAALNNSLFGAYAGENLTTGDGCVLLGYQAGSALTTESNKLYIANSNAGVGSVLMVGDFSTGHIGFGTAAATSVIDIEHLGAVTSDVDFLELTNTANQDGGAGGMINTRTSILWNQWYYDGVTPAVADAAKITIGTETDWTSVAGTQDAYMSLCTALDGTVAERWRIASTGALSNTGALGTAYIHLKAGGSTANTAPLMFTDGSTLATIQRGAIEMYKSALWFQPCATLIKQHMDGTIFSQTTAVTVANTAVATTLMGAGRGGDGAAPLDLPADFWTLAGKTVHVSARGFLSATGGGAPTVIFHVVLEDADTTKVVVAAAALGVVGRTNMGWEIETDITCYSTGAAGNFWGQGFAKIASSTTAADVLQMVNTAVTANIDTTNATTLDVKVTWSDADAGNTATCTNLTVKVSD